MAQRLPERKDGVISVEELQTHSVGDIFLGTTRRLLEPLVLFDIEHCGFMGLNQEYDLRLRHGYSAKFYDIRVESHGDYLGAGNHGGQVWPSTCIGEMPEGIEIAATSADFMRWLALESGGFLSARNEPRQYLEWLSEGLHAGRLAICERFEKPTIVTEIDVVTEDRFKEYVSANNTDDNIALDHPQTAMKYL